MCLYSRTWIGRALLQNCWILMKDSNGSGFICEIFSAFADADSNCCFKSCFSIGKCHISELLYKILFKIDHIKTVILRSEDRRKWLFTRLPISMRYGIKNLDPENVFDNNITSITSRVDQNGTLNHHF